MKSKISALISRLLIALKLRKPAKTKDVLASYRANRQGAIKSLDQVRVENSTVAARYEVKADSAARTANVHQHEANTAAATQQTLAALAVMEDNLTPLVHSCTAQPARRADSGSSYDSCAAASSYGSSSSSSYDSSSSSSSSDSGSSSVSSSD